MRLRARVSPVAAAVLAGLSFGPVSAQETQIGFQSVEWSLDGKRLLVTAIERKPDYSDYDPEKWRLVLVDLESGALRRIETGATTGCFSPDGARIAFVGGRDGAQEIWTVAPDGSGAKRLTHSEGAKPFNPAWSPDGKEVLYYLEKGDQKDQVWIIGADGAGATNVTHDEEHNIFPGWGPKGRLVFSVKDRIVSMPRAGGPKTEIKGTSGYWARVSPDGSKIA
jgi:Tol biopolymer transport system component